MATSYSRTAGIDISKSHLDVALWPKPHQEQRYDNDTKSAQRLVQALVAAGVQFVAVEATGGYETRIVTALQHAGIPVHVARPLRVRQFAKGHGFAAKTDAIDAQVLALFAMQARNLQPVEPVSDRLRQIDALRKRRLQLEKQRVAEKNRLEKLEFSDEVWEREIAKEIRRSIARIAKQLDAYLVQIEGLIREDAKLNARLETLEAQRGVGRKTAVALIAGLPELGKVNRRRIAALVGVACYAKDSGSHSGKRRIRGGRSDVRSALYMANLTNTRKGSGLHGVYQGLLSRGKPKLVAQVAVMRRFLIQLNTAMREHERTLAQAV